MADYQRILSYLYRYEKAEKKECFGFVKAEQKSGRDVGAKSRVSKKYFFGK